MKASGGAKAAQLLQAGTVLLAVLLVNVVWVVGHGVFAGRGHGRTPR
jgi:hypothetical protein